MSASTKNAPKTSKPAIDTPELQALDRELNEASYFLYNSKSPLEMDHNELVTEEARLLSLHARLKAISNTLATVRRPLPIHLLQSWWGTEIKPVFATRAGQYERRKVQLRGVDVKTVKSQGEDAKPENSTLSDPHSGEPNLRDEASTGLRVAEEMEHTKAASPACEQSEPISDTNHQKQVDDSGVCKEDRQAAIQDTNEDKVSHRGEGTVCDDRAFPLGHPACEQVTAHVTAREGGCEVEVSDRAQETNKDEGSHCGEGMECEDGAFSPEHSACEQVTVQVTAREGGQGVLGRTQERALGEEENQGDGGEHGVGDMTVEDGIGQAREDERKEDAGPTEGEVKGGDEIGVGDIEEGKSGEVNMAGLTQDGNRVEVKARDGVEVDDVDEGEGGERETNNVEGATGPAQGRNRVKAEAGGTADLPPENPSVEELGQGSDGDRDGSHQDQTYQVHGQKTALEHNETPTIPNSDMISRSSPVPVLAPFGRSLQHVATPPPGPGNGPAFPRSFRAASAELSERNIEVTPTQPYRVVFPMPSETHPPRLDVKRMIAEAAWTVRAKAFGEAVYERWVAEQAMNEFMSDDEEESEIAVQQYRRLLLDCTLASKKEEVIRRQVLESTQDSNCPDHEAFSAILGMGEALQLTLEGKPRQDDVDVLVTETLKSKRREEFTGDEESTPKRYKKPPVEEEVSPRAVTKPPRSKVGKPSTSKPSSKVSQTSRVTRSSRRK